MSALPTRQAHPSRNQKGGNPSLGSPHRGKEVKIEEKTLSLLRKRPGNPEPEDVVLSRGMNTVAARGTEVLHRSVAPGTAPHDTL